MIAERRNLDGHLSNDLQKGCILCCLYSLSVNNQGDHERAFPKRIGKWHLSDSNCLKLAGLMAGPTFDAFVTIQSMELPLLP